MRLLIKPIYQFDKYYVKEPRYSKEDGLKKCDLRCIGIRNGHISLCEHALYVSHINRTFGTSLPEYEGIDFFDETMTGAVLMRKLKEPLELCRYCVRGADVGHIDWALSKGKHNVGDFFADE